MAEKLYALAISTRGAGTETVYDLYCGTSTIRALDGQPRARRLG
jgi:tRNA/tmRNA/rRNA uracil-C5-methylase (TrmA/RlmC/RlmD family)